MPEPVVRLRTVSKRYGPIVAVSEVDLDLFPGEVHVVAGENGAGKSTLMRLLAQIEPADSGSILVDGAEMSFHGPRSAQRLGISMVHQELALAPDLTVAENLFLGREPSRLGVIGRSEQTRRASVLLQRVGLNVDPGRVVRGLSVAQQQLMEIAKALGVDARVVIMDEPTATLNDTEVDELLDVIGNLRSTGIAVLYICHRLEEIFRIADRVTVMRDGRVVETRAVGELDERTLVRLMVGRDIAQLYPTPDTTPGEVVLRVSGLGRSGRLGPCDFSVRAGEVLGIAGLVGSGRTELVRAVFGAYPIDTGQVEVDGVVRRIRRPSDGLTAGICYLSEDRKGDGLAVDLPIAHNITMASLPSFYGVLRLSEERRRAERRRDGLGIRTPSVDRAVRTLSGGNQQKVAVAKLLETNARVLLLDEPARGIDVGAKAEMFRLIAELSRLEGKQSKAIAMVSSYLPELLAMCHRLLVMHEGRIAGELVRTDPRWSEEGVMALATGASAAAASGGAA
ncbi:sugar ABC transporter ATP-binding protein [Flindersiella endophytica]